MSEKISLPTDHEELTVRSVFRAGVKLWEDHKASLARLSGVIVGINILLALAMRSGLYGTIVEITSFTPQGIFEALAPWSDLREGAVRPLTGSLGPMAGLLGVLAGVIAFLGTMALLRALSLAYHGHGAPFWESILTAMRRLASGVGILVLQVALLLVWPLLAFIFVILLTRALFILHIGGALGGILAWAPLASGVILGAGALWLSLLRLTRVAFALPACIDQGLSIRAAMAEADRLADGLRSFIFRGLLALLVIGVVVGAVFPVMLGSGIGLIGLSLESSSLLLATALVLARSLTDALLTSLFYVLYRACLSVKGGARRE